VRFTLVLLAVCLSGCGGCVDEGGSEGHPDPTPASRPASSVTRILPRALRGPAATLTIVDAGAGDE